MAALKQIGELLGTFRALPHLAGYGVWRRIVGQDRAFTAASERLARLPGLWGVYTRRSFYRAVLAEVGPDAYLGFMTLLSKPAARIGAGAYVGRFCILGWVDIGPGAMLADGVQVLSGRHQHGTKKRGRDPFFGAAPKNGSRPLFSAWRDRPQEFVKVTIGAGAWIGAGAIVMADVGERAVVGAGAVVVHPVPAGARVAGVPARALEAAAPSPPGERVAGTPAG